jgi:hypothetical protein
MRYLLLLACLLLVACGGETAPIPTAAPTVPPPTQTPLVIVIVITATPEPTKAARPALAASTPPTTASATATPTATDTAVSSSPTSRPTRTITPTFTPSNTRLSTRTPAPTATPCGNPDAREWARQIIQFNTDITNLWYTVHNPGSDSDGTVNKWRQKIIDARKIEAPPPGYEYADDDWHQWLDALDNIPSEKTRDGRQSLWNAAQKTYTQWDLDYLAQRNLECGTPEH